MRSRSGIETGYDPAELEQWARRARAWASGTQADDLPRLEPDRKLGKQPRDVFVYFIASAKERNPAAAMALLRVLGR
jgi:uncharacterized protein YecE (DUF72 family)